MDTSKRRAVVSYENMSEEVAAAFAEKYPRGAVDFIPDVQKITKPDGTSIYTVTIEIPSAIYLVKVPIKVDDSDDIDRWLDSDDDTNSGGDEDEGDTLPDDNISQYSSGEDDPADNDD